MILGWGLWALILFFQNISFTYVSRARSSGSLLRHLKASIFSNGIWILSQMVLLGPMFDYLTGKHGHSAQFASGLVYTVACVSGSIFAHFLALKTEHGKNAVGYSKKYAQIPVEVWVRVQEIVADYDRTKGLAETAYAVGVGSLPDSGISAKKVGGVQVTTGL